jgi:NAD(P)-dependent dehydrogenase (short-subunit alcohol dehydrogenase family)
VLAVDVSEASAIRVSAQEFEKQHPRLDILVNNAGAWFTDRRESRDGHELTLATNVLGPYLLTKLLEPRLRASGPARVVNIVSAFAGDYDANDLEWKTRKWDGFKAYGQSKLALRMLTWGQARRLEGSGVTANAAAPGFVKTDFNQNAHGFMAAMIGFSAKLFAVTPAKGADTPLWAAATAELAGQSGKYFDGRKEKDGKYRDAPAVDDLERRCEELVSSRA